jgi:hypothetical protein
LVATNSMFSCLMPRLSNRQTNLASMVPHGASNILLIIYVWNHFPISTVPSRYDSLQRVFSAQHYLLHLLREKLTASKSRVVVVSSGAIRGLTDTSTLDSLMKAQSGAEMFSLYPATKFTQLLGAHWWRRQLQNQCQVVAVSPGQYYLLFSR